MRLENTLNLSDKCVLITGGTGSLGKALLSRLISMGNRAPKKIKIFSRDEAKQHDMRMKFLHKKEATDEIIYNNFKRSVEFIIGDVRDMESLSWAVNEADIIIHAAALKQIPSCEYFPVEAIKTNILGSKNIIKAVKKSNYKAKKVVGISTDKACSPVNSYGMTKSLMERIFVSANINQDKTSFSLVRYGNVLASRGSVIPYFKNQIKNGGPVTITDKNMTRFFFSIDDAVNVIFKNLIDALPGEIVIPILPSFTIINIAKVLIGNNDIELKEIGLRPGEKLHESLISYVESHLSFRECNDYYFITPMLPELKTRKDIEFLKKSYTSSDNVNNFEETKNLLKRNNLL